MNRFHTIMALVALTMCLTAQAAEQGDYEITAEATRVGDAIQVSASMFQVKQDKTKTQISSPRMMFNDGSRGTFFVGQERPRVGHPILPVIPAPESQPRRATTQSTVPATAEVIESGIKIDFISIKGKGKVLMVATVIEEGATIWAEAKVLEVGAKPAPAK